MNNDPPSRPLYNSEILNTYVKFLKTSLPGFDMNDVFMFANIRPHEVADQGHWFTQEQFENFYDKLVEFTGNKNIAREVGHFAATSESVDTIRRYILGLNSPERAYEIIARRIQDSTRFLKCEFSRLSANKVEITVVPEADICEKSFQCDHRIGIIEALPIIFDNLVLTIDHPECCFRNAKVCRYIISWRKASYVSLTSFVGFCSLTLGIVFVFSLFIHSWFPIFLFINTLALLLAGYYVFGLNKEKSALEAGINSLRNFTDKLLQQLDYNNTHALFMNEIGQAVGKQTDLNAILKKLINVLQKRLEYDRGMILLADTNKTSLYYRAGFGYSSAHLDLLQKYHLQLNLAELKGVFSKSFWNQKPFLLNDFNDIKGEISSAGVKLWKRFGGQSLIVCPIICEGESGGVLVIENVKANKPLMQNDLGFLMGIATVIGISIRNAMLNEAREQQFSSTLQVLAASIDARDNLTAGHVEKVTQYVLGICQELNLSKDYTEMIRVASLLHDYGKIGIPDAILKKKGKLTPGEYAQVQSHVEKTREILEEINFEGIYRQVPEVAGSHHEKIDGTGYPKGLKGTEIPFGAKIIAVADFFEAITAERHYRGPMPLPLALRLLQDKKGSHFDEKVVDAFICYFEKSETAAEDGKVLYHKREPRCRRVPCRATVSFQVGDKTISGISTDISAKGMYVAIDCDIEEGIPLDLTFSLPTNGFVTIHASGRIAWVNNGKKRLKPIFPCGVGVEFFSVEPALELVQSFVGSCAN